MAESANHFEQSKRGRGRVKHSILKYYLGAYFGTLGQCKYIQKVIYVDGFAGSGVYRNEDGTEEEGSPIVAYKTATEHMHYDNMSEIHLIFIEANKKNYEQLKNSLENVKREDRPKVKVEVIFDSFHEVMQQILGDKNLKSEPMLVFVDPFGIKGVPMNLMQQIVSRPTTEVLINVMFSSFNRWYKNPKLNNLFNTFLGEENSEWKRTVFNNSNPKSDEFLKYYSSKLADKGSFQHIFAIKDQRNRNVYQLLFITQHFKGVVEMKKSMYRQSQESDRFIYSEWLEEKIKENKQPPHTLKPKELQQIICNVVLEKYRGEPVTGKEICIFITCDTPYLCNVKTALKKHFKRFQISEGNKFDKIKYDFCEELY